MDPNIVAKYLALELHRSMTEKWKSLSVSGIHSLYYGSDTAERFENHIPFALFNKLACGLRLIGHQRWSNFQTLFAKHQGLKRLTVIGHSLCNTVDHYAR